MKAPKHRDLTGQRFGRLVALRYEVRPGKKNAWFCLCDCGKTTLSRADVLITGRARSCNCLRDDETGKRFRRHGHNGTVQSPEHRSWSSMLNRVSARKGKYQLDYRLRGITVCERWRKFENFLADMGPRPAGKSLDRIDNDGNYEPGNCRWATQSEQIRNRRSRARVAADREKALQILKKEQGA